MFHHILVPLDGSERAERAIPVALRLVRASGGSLIFLRVISIVNHEESLLSAHPSPASTDVETELTEAQRYLAHVRTAYCRQGVAITTMTRVGLAASAIVQVASEEQVDMIVICSRGHTGLVRRITGSVSEKVACNSSAPVLILREGGPIPAGPHPDASRTMRILVPLDGSLQAQTALAPAATLVAGLTAPGTGALHLTRVIKPLPVRYKQKAAAMEQLRTLQRAKDYLQQTVEYLRTGCSTPETASNHLTLTWSVAADTQIADAIVRVAETGDDINGISPPGGCEIIAMTTHGSCGASSPSLGCITEQVLEATKLPILIMRPSLPAVQEHISLRETMLSTPHP